MCGFVGLVRADRSKKLPCWRVDSIAHRGPDELISHVERGFELTFARLSIVGVSNGRQPFVDSESGLVAVTNGEIYNHVALRQRLASLGHKFFSDSDAEAVLWGFSEWGPSVFSQMEGMWASAVFNPRSKTLTLARDRFGKKPLFWRREGQEILFGSELAAVYKQPTSCLSTHLASFLATDAVSWSLDCDCGIKEVPAGHYVTLEETTTTIREFYNLRFAIAVEKTQKRSVDDNLLAFDHRLKKSVSDRLMSDGPVGMFLSSGQDSRLIASLANRQKGLECAFTLTMNQKSFDESSAAEEFADHLGLETVKVHAGLDDLAEMWSILRETSIEPFADSAVLGEMLLSRAAAPRTKVVLTGDGGDELFLGYQHVLAHRLARHSFLRGSANLMIELFGHIMLGRKPTDHYFSNRFVLDRLSRGLKLPNLRRRDLAWRAAFSPDHANASLDEGGRAALGETLERLTSRQTGVEQFSWDVEWSIFYFETYLKDIIFRKIDRGTMRFGVEARSPLLDHRVVELALSLGLNQKSGLFTPKKPISWMLRRLEPTWSEKRRKHGMGIPLVPLLTGPLRQDVEQLLDPDLFGEVGMRPTAVLELKKRFAEDPELAAREVWALLVFSAALLDKGRTHSR